MQTTTLYKNESAFAESTAGEERILAPITGEVDDQYALLNLNPVAAFIWDHLSTNTTESALVETLRETYDIDAVTAQQDVAEIVAQFIAAGAVTCREPCAAPNGEPT